MKSKRHVVLVHNDVDFFLVEWYNDDLMLAQEAFSKGEIVPFYKFDFYKWCF